MLKRNNDGVEDELSSLSPFLSFRLFYGRYLCCFVFVCSEEEKKNTRTSRNLQVCLCVTQTVTSANHC